MRLSRHSRGFTLIELMISLAILSIALAGIFGAMLSAVSATREAKPRFIAKQAASRMLAELAADSGSLTAFYKNYWKGDAGSFPDKLSAAQVQNLGTADVYVNIEALATSVGVPTTFNQTLAPALNARLIARQGADPVMLRLRFLSEDQYNKLWGLTGANRVDLNFNGTFTDNIEQAGGAAGLGLDYVMLPVQVSVHWRDEGGDQVFRMNTIITADPDLDDTRQ